MDNSVTSRPQATILVVEDDFAILQGVSDLLEISCEAYAVTILQAENGRKALQLMQETTPDLVISDLAMPEIDGYQLIETVRQNVKWLYIPFIFLTAKANPQEIHKGRLTGVELYITKPFDAHELVELVERLLAKTDLQTRFRQQRSEMLRKQISHILQHEFRTPLTHVAGFSEMLSFMFDEVESGQELQEFLHGIQIGAERMWLTVADLVTALELSTPNAESKILEEATLFDSLDHVLHAVIKSRKTQLLTANIQLHLALPNQFPTIFGSKNALQDVFERLLDNAIKFTERQAQGNIWISAASTGSGNSETQPDTIADTISISIRDDGVGFPSQVGNDLFHLFFQHNREHWEQQGSGIGLFIAKRLIEIHGGIITAKGVPDQGAEFTVTLPIGHQQTSFAPFGSNQIATLLLVEDDIFLLEGTRDLLLFSDTSFQFNVLTATNGQEALTILEDTIPDLIVSDIMMPKLDGNGLLRAVRANPDWHAIPFIFLTALGSRRHILEGNLRGADAYITKPYHTREFIEIIVTQLDRHFKREQATQSDFEALKGQILNSLEANFIESLSVVASNTQLMREKLDRNENITDLKSALVSIQGGSSQLSYLVENFTTLVEIHTGAAQSAFELRAKMIEHVGYLVRETCATTKFKVAPALEAHNNISRHFSIASSVPPICGDRIVLAKMLKRLLYHTLFHTHPTPDASITITVERKGESVVVKLATNHSQLNQYEADAIIAFLANDTVDSFAEIDLAGSDLAIVQAVTQLHKGTATFQYEPVGQHCVTLCFPSSICM